MPFTSQNPDSRAPTDPELMAAFKAGNKDAFEQLVKRHQRGLFNFFLRSVHNQSRAEELLQDTFVRVVRAKDRYSPTAKFTTWVYTIARNICIDESRRRQHRKHLSLDAPRRGRSEDSGTAPIQSLASKDPTPGDEASNKEIRERVDEAVGKLPDDQREVFMLRQFSGLSFREISEVVGAPENTVKSRMRYALEKLRGELANLRSDTESSDTESSDAGPAGTRRLPSSNPCSTDETPSPHGAQ